MTRYHAVLLDETNCEFGASVEAPSREAAYEELRENYPESRVVQLESPEDTAERERFIYQRLQREMDGEEIFEDDPYLGDEGRW